MKKFFTLFFILLFIFLGVYIFYRGEPVKITIEEGKSASYIAKQLKDSQIIWSSLWFRVLVKITGADKKIMPGEYELKKYSPHELVLWKLTHSIYISSIKIVIPEGWRAEQIAERLKANEIIKDTKLFLKIVKEKNLEGHLFPSTYHLKKNMKEEEVIEIFTNQYAHNIKPLFQKYTLPKGLDEYKVLIIASIVEREAVIASERPLVAAVYLNRINKNMPLEADPTVQYALGYWKKNLTKNDLKYPSPYNTYYVKGLPPSPICNPGVDSIRAVLEPANIDALYFVADRKGKHIFNSKFEEHLKAKNRIEQLYKEK